jgi:hypothetical protein
MRNECDVKKGFDEITGRCNGKGKGKALLAIEDKLSSSNRVEEMYENQEWCCRANDWYSHGEG